MMFRLMTIVIVLCASAMFAQANLLVNGDFETGDLTGYNTDLQFGGGFVGSVNGNNVNGGNYSWQFDTNTSATNHYGNIEQGGPSHLSAPIPVPNSNPEVSADVLVTGQGGANQAAVMIEMYNAAGDWVGLTYWAFGGGPTSWGQGIHGGPDGPLAVIVHNMSGSNGSWTTVGANLPTLYESTFPTGTPGQRWGDMGVTGVRFLFQTWAANSGSLTEYVQGHADNFSLTDVPEPMTMSLLALGALGILRRKRS